MCGDIYIRCACNLARLVHFTLDYKFDKCSFPTLSASGCYSNLSIICNVYFVSNNKFSMVPYNIVVAKPREIPLFLSMLTLRDGWYPLNNL